MPRIVLLSSSKPICTAKPCAVPTLTQGRIFGEGSGGMVHSMTQIMEGNIGHHRKQSIGCITLVM